MEITLDSACVFAYTGGKPFDRQRPVVVLIHGAGHDHSVWNYQARKLAHRGYAVLAPDLPGHGRSEGNALTSIEALASWVEALLDAVGVPQAALVGHSMGSLVALQAAAQMQTRVTRLLLLGSVAPMPVAPPLLEAALHDRHAAHRMINQWSYAPSSQLGACAVPGMSLVGLNTRLMERQRAGVLATDLAACNAYQNGLSAAANVHVPTALICGERDQMTPRKAAKPLQEALVGIHSGAHVITIQGAGHAMMAEAPDAVSEAIDAFMQSS